MNWFKKQNMVVKIIIGAVVLFFGSAIIAGIFSDPEEVAEEPEETVETANEPVEEEEPEEVEEMVEEETEAEESEVEEMEPTRADELNDIITEKVEADYNNTSIREIKVNDDLGTGEGYIVLVDLSFDAKNRAGTSKDMIEMYSSDLAATLAEQEDINEVVSFWEVPYLQESGNVAKIATERQGEGMAFTEQWYDPNIFN